MLVKKKTEDMFASSVFFIFHPDPFRAHRKPRLPVELSGVFALRAATRYRLQ